MKRTTIAAVVLLAATVAWGGGDKAVTGRVVGPGDKPVKGVPVEVRVKAWPGGRFQMRTHATKSDKKGRFDVAGALPDEGRYGVYVSVAVPGRTLASRYVWNGKGGPLEPVDVVTHPAHPLRLRFVDTKDKPVSDVEAYPAMRSDADGARHETSLPKSGIPSSDRKGLVRMDHFLAGEWAGVHVRFPGRGWEVRNFLVPATKDAVVDVPEVPPETPNLDLRAGDDPRKRYFLMGPKAGDVEPERGFGLVLVLPGGTGAAEFRDFVRGSYDDWVDAGYVFAELVAPHWNPEQAKNLVWPIEPDREKVKGLEFTTEEFVEAVVADVGDRVKVDPKRVFTLSWSSSGPACYRISSLEKTSVTGQVIVMSVFHRGAMESLENTKGRPFFILHSPQDRTCPPAHAEQACKALRKKGAIVEFATYEGGHGWHGESKDLARKALFWLGEQTR